MVARTQIDRRRAVAQTLRLGQPLFIQVPKALAATSLTASALILILVAPFAPSSIKLGSFILLICAFAAWFIGNRFAILLGVFVLAVQYLNGHLIQPQSAKFDEVVDLIFRIGCASAVVLMLGVARVALEIEWRHARIDPLTGALNRKAFFEVIEAKRGQENLTALIFADLDGLKGLNDTFGHEAGDEAIRNFSSCVKKSIRKDDIFARLGGDEFAIFLDVRDVAAATTVAQRLHNALNHQPVDEAKLNCSFGVLLLPKGSRSIDLELRKADGLMYAAKRSRSGFSIAMMVDEKRGALLQIASGIDPKDLQAAISRSREMQPQESQSLSNSANSVAA